MTSPVSAMPTVSTFATSATPSAAAASSSDPSSLSSDAFLKLIVAQLQYQDPTQPTDTAAFMTQTATLNQIESTQQMTDAMNLLLRNGLTQEATSLVGKTVTFKDSAGATQTGLVTGARFDAAAPLLQIGGADVALGSVVSIVTPTAGTTTT